MRAGLLCGCGLAEQRGSGVAARPLEVLSLLQRGACGLFFVLCA